MTRARSSNQALTILTAYAAAGGVLALWRAASGGGSWLVVVGYVAIVAVARMVQGNSAFASLATTKVLAGWLPLLALPVLYVAIPATALGIGPFDAAIQGVDRALFGRDVAHTLAGNVPSLALSELLHGAYLSYYVIIYLPPLLMHLRGDVEAFQRTVLAFTVAMTVCFAVFWVCPVVGPRYLWSAPPGVPEGIFRRAALWVLEGGSSRGTAFPSSHLAIALAMALSSMRWDRRLGWPVLVAAVLLGVGAVYGGFHYATDMLAGGAVAVIAWFAAGRAGKVGPAARS